MDTELNGKIYKSSLAKVYLSLQDVWNLGVPPGQPQSRAFIHSCT